MRIKPLHHVIAALLAASSTTVSAADLPPAPIPDIPESAATAQAFVPEGWRLEQTARGDLNGDKIDDIALAIHSNDPKLIVQNPDGMGRDTFDSNPRSVIVALGRKGGGYSRIAANHVLIPRVDNAVIDDPFDSAPMAIQNGALTISIRFWSSAGSWSMSNTRFTFRLRDGALSLVGYDKDHIHRGSGEKTTTSVNFLTGKMSIGVGSIENDKVETRWTRLGRKPLIRFDDMEDGWSFTPSPDAIAAGE